ncbi:MAG: ribosome recycling factor [Bacteroidales bacterium]|jgi:ribosome recycling factor|nr:ribosome recycling factor [Bacteroidales bacterium]
MELSDAKKVLEQANGKMHKAVEFLENELAAYRVGKANPAVFSGVHIEYYGTPTPLAQVASISVPDARTMIIQPWDRSLISAIEKAIMVANLGFTPQNNGEIIRIMVPPLTEERRRELVKKARAEGENARISIRNARRDGVDLLKKYQKDGLSEDIVKDTEILIQKEVDAFSKIVEEVLATKEKEIMTV